MKVGNYVRTKKDGIGRIISFSYQEDDECCFIELSNRRTGIKQFNIVKLSPNIIDLIEVGDYVNGLRVNEKAPKDKRKKQEIIIDSTCVEYGELPLRQEDIKSIVTKEQFESMEYKVEE